MAHEAWNMRLLAHDGLGGFGNIGEGMAIQQTRNGRRVLWLAHESVKDFTAVDVTDPRSPRVILQTDLLHAEMRSNSLDVVGDVMYVAHQTARPGLPGAGMDILDISNPEKPRMIACFDVTAPHSRGAHCLWGVDGEYVHVKTFVPDAKARQPRDDQSYVIVDVRDPVKPVEAGRWWVPGTFEGDLEPLPERPPGAGGFSCHNVNVYPQRPDRAYGAFKYYGVVILDISDKAHPREISHLDYCPPHKGNTHTVVPLFDRELLVVTEEAVQEGGADWPKLTWVMDMSDEQSPSVLSTLPLPDPEEFSLRPGRFGAHNVHENQPHPTSFVSDDLVFGAYFNAGLRVHDISDPKNPKEIAYFIPEEVQPHEPLNSLLDGVRPPPVPGMNINDVFVDENRVIYAVDRCWGGLYVLEMTT